jgi:hypothetical protein
MRDFLDESHEIARRLAKIGLEDWAERIDGVSLQAYGEREMLDLLRQELKSLMNEDAGIPMSLRIEIRKLIKYIARALEG